MKRVLAIARLNLLELTRDRTELMSVILLPLLLTWVFGAAFGSAGVERPQEVPVADADGSIYSKRLVESIDSEDTLVVKAMSAEDAKQAVTDGEAPAALVIPAGFGASLGGDGGAEIEVVRNPSSDRAQAVVEVIEGAAGRMSANITAFKATSKALWSPELSFAMADPEPDFDEIYRTADSFWEPVAPVAVESKAVKATGSHASELEAPANTQYSLGFTVFFVFMTALGSASGVLEERELGTLRRLLAAPVTRGQILGGKIAGVALVAAFEAALLVAFGAFVFGVPWGHDPLAVGVLLLALVVTATGMGVMVSALVRTRSQMSAIAPVLSTGLAMLGGCYWPIEVASAPMQTVAKFTPTGWAMVGLKDVVARGMALDAVLVPVAVLLGMALLFFVVGMTRLRLE